jgi:hypothetical protein
VSLLSVATEFVDGHDPCPAKGFEFPPPVVALTPKSFHVVRDKNVAPVTRMSLEDHCIPQLPSLAGTEVITLPLLRSNPFDHQQRKLSEATSRFPIPPRQVRHAEGAGSQRRLETQ